MCSPAALQLDVQCGERLHADHVVHDSCCVGVVCPIVEFVYGACRILKTLIPIERERAGKLEVTLTITNTKTDFSVFKPLLFSDILRVAWIDHTDGFGQVSENCRVVQIQNGRGVVTQHPGELRRNGGEVPLRCSVLTAGSSGESRRTHHWILGKVVVGAASNGVQLHQVLKVGDFSVHPFLVNTSALDLFMVLAHKFYINQTLRRAHD